MDKTIIKASDGIKMMMAAPEGAAIIQTVRL